MTGQTTGAPPRVGCAVLGATGAVGQRFIERLSRHPFFDLRSLVASERSAGKRYEDAANWILDAPVPEDARDVVVETVTEMEARDDIHVVFSALPGGEAGPVETRLAERGLAVFTNAKDHRMDADVPLLIPEVNPDHLELVERQPTRRGGTGGFIVANGNCSGIVLTMALAPIHRAFGLEDVHVTTMQGLSGAGYPGVPGLDIVDNVVPFIGDEEDKLETEPQKTLGSLQDGTWTPAAFTVHPTCTRVPVREGHLESVHVRCRRPVSADTAAKAFSEFRGPNEVQGLPTAPQRPIHVLTGADRPQPRRDRDIEDGMAVSVGRLRANDDGWLRFFVLGHNTVRGAAGQSVLNAEFAYARGLVAKKADAVAQ